jgi:hypothetical protein
VAFIKKLKADKLKNGPLAELLNPELASKIIFEDDL